MDKNLYLICERSGYAPEIGRLVSMLNYARDTTLETVEGLTVEQLDYLHDSESNSIGALLKHVAAVEVSYQVLAFEDRSLSRAEMKEWGPALVLADAGRKAIRGENLDHYLNLLRRVRETTLRELRKRDEKWLFRELPFWGGRPANHYFLWFHVLEDEINHRGQMRWLLRRLPGS